MNLYEITTGWMGESYERCYAYAIDEEAARLMFNSTHQKREIESITLLFNVNNLAFITKLSDSGFQM